MKKKSPKKPAAREPESEVYLAGAKNPKRPTVAECMARIADLDRKLYSATERYEATAEGQLAALRDKIDDIAETVGNIDDNMVRR